jgi:hypothetical protein
MSNGTANPPIFRTSISQRYTRPRAVAVICFLIGAIFGQGLVAMVTPGSRLLGFYIFLAMLCLFCLRYASLPNDTPGR